MKIVINYDLIDEIKNAKEPLEAFKIIRNNKKLWAKWTFPLCLVIGIPNIKANGFFNTFLCGSLGIFMGTSLMEFITYICCGDTYKRSAIYRLLKLIIELRENNINTDYELLLDSYEYERKYKLRLNENKLIQVLESKYLIIPTHGVISDEETALVQEHVVGSNTYILSFGSPEKKLKLVMEGV